MRSLLIQPDCGELIEGTKAIHAALGGAKTILPDEQKTIDFAYACVVTTREISAGEELTTENIWVKRPGTGEIKARQYGEVLGRRVKQSLPRNSQVKWSNLQ